ncbi:hypothetical protein GCM10010339_89280 [Streptomyces alanosinicus]|uniref:Uncharacterized protein n=1 Tax=Streptomyces alanosinicus TaxID=68171 RepID=A0A918YTE8_9ACTN|nr:hypothetical protein GCM10010339_89280 [Streptomyces alanosinicus]
MRVETFVELLDGVLCGEADVSLVAAECGCESQKAQVVAGISFVAEAESAVAGQPRHSALDELAQVAADGVAPPGSVYFPQPWASGKPFE